MNGINRARYITLLSLFCCSLLLAGCGESGSGSGMLTNNTKPTPSKPTDKPAPGAFNLTSITPSTTKAKTLVFSWDASSNAKSYTLCRAKDTSAADDMVNCTVLKDTLTATTTTVTTTGIIDPSLIGNTFFVIAKNASSNKSSNEKSLSLNDYIAMIAYLKASNIGKNDQFSISVALSSDGKTLAVGANNEDSSSSTNPTDDKPNSGAVYVFSRSDNTWKQQQYLKASNPDENDSFGSSVALSGDGKTLAVGAYAESSNSSTNQNDNHKYSSGAVYVFNRSGSSSPWTTPPQYLKASKIDTEDHFGVSVALSNDGNTLAIGVNYEDSNSSTVPTGTGANESGAVYVFSRSSSGSAWGTTPQYLKASNIDKEDHFGVSVALSGNGNTLAVGATNEDSGVNNDAVVDNTKLNSGAVYVFNRSSSGSAWGTTPQYLKASNIDKEDHFGVSVALSNDGNTLAVGANHESSGVNNDAVVDNTKPNSGAVYVFNRSGSSSPWTTTPQYLKAKHIGKYDNFGTSVALSSDGKTLAVGANGEASSSTTDPTDTGSSAYYDSGAVYVFSRSSSTWTQKKYLKAKHIGGSDYFGWSIALSSDGNTLAVGAYQENSSKADDPTDDGANHSGAVYIY